MSSLRSLLLLLLLIFVPSAAWAEPDRTTVLQVEGRDLDVLVWESRTPDPEGIILFGHGHGADPAAYDALLSHWASRNFTVYAPLNVDSHVHPDRTKFDMQSGFVARIADLMAAREMIAAAHAGKPVVLAGHSFGSLMALLGGGARTKIMPPLAGPPVAGVLAFSTAGRLPPLLANDAYAGLDVPLLLITGTADLVPGFVADWRDHRVAFDRGPEGDKTLLVVEDGTHDLVRMNGPSAATLISWSDLFLAATLSDDPAATALYETLSSGARVRVERR